MIVGIQTLTPKCLARVFSLKIFLGKLLTISWVMRAYIVLVKVWEKAHLKSSKQRVSRVTHDLAQVVKWLPKSSLAKRLFQFQHVLLMWPFTGWHSRASLELISNSSSSQSFTNLSHTTLTLNPTKIIGKWLNRNTIKFDMKLKSI